MRGIQLRVGEGVRLQFDGCDMTDADLYGSTLCQARFFDCDLTRVDFSQADVRGARLHGSTLERIRGVGSLGGVTVSSAQALPLALQLLPTAGIEVDDDRGLEQ